MQANSPHASVLELLVSALKRLPRVRAVGLYGSTATRSWLPSSDVDLVAILDGDPPAESVRFFVSGIPVDLNLRSADATPHGIGGAAFVPAMQPAWDPDGLLAGVAETSPLHSPDEARALRYLVAHSIAKVQQLRHDPIVTRIAIGAECGQFLRAALQARGKAYPGTVKALQFIAGELPELIALLDDALREPQRAQTHLSRAADVALGPLGGAWRPGEILVVGWDRKTSLDIEEAISELLGPVHPTTHPPRTFP